MKYYKQCTFRQEKTVTTAWIEERGAKVGKKVKFKDADNDDWWDVISVGEDRRPETAVKISERSYLHQRSMSDI